MVHEDHVNHANASDPNKLFSKFMQAQTCHQTFSSFLDLCEVIDLSYPPSPSSSSSSSSYDHISFYPRLKKKLSSWKAQPIWSKLDKRFFGKEYFVNPKEHNKSGQRAGADMKVVIIGAGPCGLRTAIDMACLGTKVVVVEKRDNFARNNVLHLWPFLITDLKTLGAKKLYGRFCVGAIDHISIRQLQLILLKVALMLGVEVIVNVLFEALIPPSDLIDSGVKGWTAAVQPSNHPVSNFQFDVIVGADGKRNTLKGFKRKEFRGKLAIGLTVNFINRNTSEEAKVEEISGVAYIFNQEFFKGLQREKGIDLENIVYYKGETHYFVMTAKKHSLVAKGVLKQDYDDTSQLLSYENVDMEAMMTYAREAADFSTHNQLPSLDFAINKHGQPDVALFDFTCMYAAVNAALFREINGHKLLSCLVGDSLLEPFWPMGTGCARGFLAAFDTVWMTKQWAIKRKDARSSDTSVELEVLAERESIYRMLHQTTPQNTVKNIAAYTIDPFSRYVHINMASVSPNRAKEYYLSDRDIPDVPDNRNKLKPPSASNVEFEKSNNTRSTLTRKVSMVRSSKLQSWCQRMTEGYKDVHITNMASSWKDGLAICALIHRFRPDLINWNELDSVNIENNNQLAFDIAEKQLGISPVLTGKEMLDCQQVDKLLMVTYISQFYEMFKHETPSGLPPASTEDVNMKEDDLHKPHGVSLTSPVGLLTRIHQHIKRRAGQSKHDDNGKKKKTGHPKMKEASDSSQPVLAALPESEDNETANLSSSKAVPPEPESMEIAGTNVKLRPKMQQSDEGGISKATVHQRASNRISALSNQLISQWEQNAPQPSPRTARRSQQTEHLSEISNPSASDKCYFCLRRVYIVERLSVEGLFFHRQCFVCSHCGLTLRRGAYEFVKETGKFFCHTNCIAAAETCKHPAKAQEEQIASQNDDLQEAKDTEKIKRTPERIEVENIPMLNQLEELSEEALTRHNFSTGTDPDRASLPDDLEYMSDSSDDDIDWGAILKEAANRVAVSDLDDDYDSLASHSSLEGSKNSNDINDVTTMSLLLDDSCDCDRSSSGSTLESHQMMTDVSEDSEASDVLSVADASSHDSLSDVHDENEASATKEQGIVVSSSSSASLSDPVEEMSSEHDRKKGEDQKAEEALRTDHKESEPDSQPFKELPNLPVEDSVVTRDCLSSISSSSDPGTAETKEGIEELMCSDSVGKIDLDEAALSSPASPTDEIVRDEAALASPTDEIGQDEAILEEEAPKNTDVIPSSSSKITEESSDLKHERENTIEENNSKKLGKLDTLDKIQEYLINNPVAVEIVTNPVEERSLSKENENSSNHTTSSSSVSLSSSTSDMAEFEVLDLLEEKETKVEVPISLVVEKSLEKCSEDQRKELKLKDLPKTPLSNIRILPRQSSVDSILIRASNSLKSNNTGVWPNKERIGDACGHETPSKDVNLAASFDESFLSNYRSCEEKTPSNSVRKPQPPVERRLSYDSLERRMKLRLRARNRWLRQESNPKKTLTRSSSERTSRSSRSPSEDTHSKDDITSLSPTNSIVIVESSPPIETFLTPTAPPKSRQQSLEFDEDSFYTPLGSNLKTLPLDIGPESFTIPSPKSSAMDSEKEKIAQMVPAISIPSDAQKAGPPQPAPRKVLPSLPKVPHLEAISPTGSAPIAIDRRKKLEEDFRVREARVKERIEKIKAETLRRKKQKSEATVPPIDENDSRLGVEVAETVDQSPTGSGYSPKPTQKHLFKKSTRGKDGERRVKRALPVPHVSGQPLTELQTTHRTVSEERKDKQHKKHRKDSADERRSDKHTKSTGDQRDQKNKSFFRMVPRRKHHKKEKVAVDVVDGPAALGRKYDSQSDREKAMLRGERFRLLPDPPSAASRLDSYESPDEEELTKKYWEHKRRATAGLTAAQIDAKITRRVQIAARRQAKLEAQKRLRRAQVIQRQLEEVEVRQKDLEERGVILEKMLRTDGEEREDSKPMQEWFKLVQEKNGLLRYENELMVYQRELQLEDVQSRLQQDLRERMAMDDKRKTSTQLAQEKEILQRMLEVVEQRDELVALLEEQRLKERDESVDTETLMLNKFNLISEDSPRVSGRSSSSLKSLA